MANGRRDDASTNGKFIAESSGIVGGEAVRQEEWTRFRIVRASVRNKQSPFLDSPWPRFPRTDEITGDVASAAHS